MYLLLVPHEASAAAALGGWLLGKIEFLLHGGVTGGHWQIESGPLIMAIISSIHKARFH